MFLVLKLWVMLIKRTFQVRLHTRFSNFPLNGILNAILENVRGLQLEQKDKLKHSAILK